MIKRKVVLKLGNRFQTTFRLICLIRLTRFTIRTRTDEPRDVFPCVKQQGQGKQDCGSADAVGVTGAADKGCNDADDSGGYHQPKGDGYGFGWRIDGVAGMPERGARHHA